MPNGVFSFLNSEIWCRHVCANISVWFGQVVIVSMTWKRIQKLVVEANKVGQLCIRIIRHSILLKYKICWKTEKMRGEAGEEIL